MQTIIDFFNSPAMIVIGGLYTLFTIFGVIYLGYLVLKGVMPVWYRLGIGLSKRSIAIFSETEYSSLRKMLIDSKIFKACNIEQIHLNDLKSAKKHTIFLVHWKDFQSKLSEILEMKDDSTALVVYAPQNEGRIEPNDMDAINLHRNSIVVNFRGRLINDILVSLITTVYGK